MQFPHRSQVTADVTNNRTGMTNEKVMFVMAESEDDAWAQAFDYWGGPNTTVENVRVVDCGQWR